MLTRFIENLLDAQTPFDVRAIFLDSAAHFGFDHATYAAHFMLTVPRSLVREHPAVFSNLPDEFLEELRQIQALDKEPWVQWVLANDGDIAVHDLLSGRASDASPSLALAMRHGLGTAQIISLRDKVLHSAGAVILMPGKGADTRTLDDLWARWGREMRVLAWVMHMRMATMHRKPPLEMLTPRQREVLSWRSAGKTVGEIATILNITPATVEKHMRLAREALGVETTPQAVLKAHVTHQLFQPTPVNMRLWGDS